MSQSQQILNLESDTVDPFNQQPEQNADQKYHHVDEKKLVNIHVQNIQHGHQNSLMSPGTAGTADANLIYLKHEDHLNPLSNRVMADPHQYARMSTNLDDNLHFNLPTNQLLISKQIAEALQAVYCKDYANPGPLGLIGFGMTTLLLNIHNVQHYPASSMICGMGIFVGGIAQIIAGIFEFIKKNTFAQTAFIGYGCFWLSLVALWSFPAIPLKAHTIAPNQRAVGWYLFSWGAFTFVMFFGTFKLNRMLQVVFSTLICCFWLLAIGEWADNLKCTKAAGWIGIVCGATAMYGAVAQIINELYGRSVMPIGPMKKNTKMELIKLH